MCQELPKHFFRFVELLKRIYRTQKFLVLQFIKAKLYNIKSQRERGKDAWGKIWRKQVSSFQNSAPSGVEKDVWITQQLCENTSSMFSIREAYLCLNLGVQVFQGISRKKHKTMPAGLTTVLRAPKEGRYSPYSLLYNLSNKNWYSVVKDPQAYKTLFSRAFKTSILGVSQGLIWSQRQTHYWEYTKLERLKPAELTLSCADGWYTNNHLVIWGVEPGANLDVFVDPLISLACSSSLLCVCVCVCVIWEREREREIYHIHESYC